jgi:PIN domain nuclease of toxin-antitoxin system
LGPVGLLLDTHALLWWILDDPKLPAKARRLIADPDNAVFVSSASAWEITTKHRKGKLPRVGDVADRLEDYVWRAGFSLLPVTFAQAAASGRLPGLHNDPFDRLLIAQSLAERLPVVTLDAVFADYGVEAVWA